MSPSLGSLSETFNDMAKNIKPKTLLEQVQEELEKAEWATLRVKKGRKVNVYSKPNSGKSYLVAKLEEGDIIDTYDELFPSENSSSTFAKIRNCTLNSSDEDAWMEELQIEGGYVSLASEGLELKE